MLPLLFNNLLRHQIQLWVELLPILLDGQGLQLCLQATCLIPALFTTGCNQLKGQKQRPFGFNAFELGQLLRFVVQTAHVFHHRLVAIAQETFVSVGSSQLAAAPAGRALRPLRLSACVSRCDAPGHRRVSPPLLLVILHASLVLG